MQGIIHPPRLAGRFSLFLPFRIQGRRYLIRPTRYGMLFLAMLFASLLGSINHSNNLGFLLTFLLGGMMAISVIHGFANLRHIGIAIAAAAPVFAGETARIPIILGPTRSRRIGLGVSFAKSHGEAVDLSPGSPARLAAALRTRQRGLVTVDTVYLSSIYPLGLFSLMERRSVSGSCLVYPRPVRVDPRNLPGGRAAQQPEGEVKTVGRHEFSELTPYRPGDDIRRAHWKSLARGRGLHTIKFEEEVQPEQMFSLDLFPGDDLETRLGKLCHLVLAAEAGNRPYGLQLGKDRQIARGRGPGHRAACLKALALYGLER